MEFVLNTTKSTPTSSGRASSVMFGVLGSDDDRSGSDFSACGQDFKHESSDSEGDASLLEEFNEINARNRLFQYPTATTLALSIEQQKEIGIEIGVNVTEEHPWKQVRKETLLETLIDELAEIEEFREKLLLLDENALILVGYAPDASTDDKDIFVFFENEDDAREASDIIKRLEAFDRQYLRKSLHKYSRPWKSLGSEKEVNLQIQKKRTETVEIEIQRLDAGRRVHKPFQYRFSDDIRDGYVELVPKHDENDILQRKRINLPIQSAPQMVSIAQQTDPTFPANAWTQYLYEIGADDDEDVSDDDETNENTEVILPSDSITELLKILEFNAIDMYRNDYSYITKNELPTYTNPYLEEIFCFTDPSKCRGKYACGIDWHPTYSGIVAVSYTYSTLNTLIENDEIDPEFDKKLAMSTNPILIWSFDDTLYPKLELASIREITCITFCPYDENVLIGGSVTGQIIIWDLKNRLKRVEMEEILTENQLQNRKSINAFMNWTQIDNDKRIVYAVAISSAEHSQKAAITSMKWLNRKYFVANTGQLLESPKPDELYRHFVTSSLDGTVSFWDLDYVDTNETKVSALKMKYNLPDYMKEETSPYERLNNNIRPNYTIAYDRPISNFIFDEGIFRYQPIQSDANRKIVYRVRHNVIEVAQENLMNRFIVASLVGTISVFNCEGFLCKEGKPEYVKQAEIFASIHDGPVLTVERNPFFSELFLSIGKNIIALWSDQSFTAPIFWRRRPSAISCAKWSTNRASVFFLTYYDGSVDVWDILTRIDEPSVVHNLGGNILTVLSQHKLSLPHEVIAIGDQNGNLRILKLPERISKPVTNEIDLIKEYVKRELLRREKFSEWQINYNERNTDIRQAKQSMKEDAAKALEKIEREARDRELLKQKKELEDQQKATIRAKNKTVYDLPERLHQKWDAMNIKRLMNVLLAMKRFDPELLQIRTKPERDRLAYEDEKRRAIHENVRNFNAEIAEIRARLMPQWDENENEQRLQSIRKNVNDLINSGEIGFEYAAIENEAIEMLLKIPSNKNDLSWQEILERARNRREKSNRSLIRNTNFKRSYTKQPLNETTNTD